MLAINKYNHLNSCLNYDHHQLQQYLMFFIIAINL